MIPFIDPPSAINRLVVAVVGSDEVCTLVDRLIGSDFGVTRIDSAGGFLRRGNSTLLIGTPVGRLPDVLTIIAGTSATQTPIDADVTGALALDGLLIAAAPEPIGGSIVFVLEVDRVVYVGDLV